jgi:NTE family protein
MRCSCPLLLLRFFVVLGLLVPSGVAMAAELTRVEVGPTLGRPRVGLVLSGGGARGLAHVGVLKVLERERIPIDAIAGTSMGAIIGGLYASGLRADDLERELLALDWATLFANRLPRETLSQRRKEEDFEISPALEVGLGRASGELMLPIGSVSSRGLELLLRRYTLPVRQVASFDALPIAFRAVATDMESGEAVVFRQGDLAQALRASMSVPGVFPPTEVDHRILGDGGLVNNLPVDVVRAMGVDVVIAVNIGTPLAGRDSLGTVLGLTSQMVNILTEQNVQRSLATLDPARDVLIAPPLGRLTSGDFDRAADLIAAGERHTAGLVPQLAALRLGETDWLAMRRGQQRLDDDPPQPIASVRFEGQDITEPERLRGALAVQPGQPFSVERAERDSRTLAASGDYLHVDYRVEDLPAGTGLVYRVEEKPWGPHYFRLGLDVQSDFAGRGEFNVKLSHNRHWLDGSGSEWRNRAQIGSIPRWFSELYVPLGAGSGPASDWFLAGWAEIERRRLTTYQPLLPDQSARALTVLGRQVRGQLRMGLDVGQPLGDLGEWRVGLVHDALSLDAETTAGTTDTTALAPGRSREWALRSALVIDQLDHASFPRQGWRLKLGVQSGRRTLSGAADGTGSDPFHRLEADVTQVASLGRQTVETTLRLRHARQREAPGQVGHYTLGGFHNLSGYEIDQLAGNDTLLGRLTWMLRLNRQPVLTRGVFAGVTLEAGNAWISSRAVSLQDLRWGGSVFLGADTGLGPMYLGLTYAPRGRAGVSLMLGRP